MCSGETAIGPDNAGASLNVSNDRGFFFTKRKSEIVGFCWIFHQWQTNFFSSWNFHFGLLERGIMCKIYFSIVDYRIVLWICILLVVKFELGFCLHSLYVSFSKHSPEIYCSLQNLLRRIR
jgi:hypothetical protein